MSSNKYHRFQPPKISKFGSIPSANRIYINAKNNIDIPVDVPVEQTTNPPVWEVWEVLGISENEYYEKYIYKIFHKMRFLWN